MIDFYQDKFRYIHFLSLQLIRELLKKEDISEEKKRIISQLINSRHISLSALRNFEAESALNDLLPEVYWEKLEVENFQTFEDFFDQFRMGNSVFSTFEECEPILFASLQSTFEFHGLLKREQTNSSPLDF